MKLQHPSSDDIDIAKRIYQRAHLARGVGDIAFPNHHQIGHVIVFDVTKGFQCLRAVCAAKLRRDCPTKSADTEHEQPQYQGADDLTLQLPIRILRHDSGHRANDRADTVEGIHGGSWLTNYWPEHRMMRLSRGLA